MCQRNDTQSIPALQLLELKLDHYEVFMTKLILYITLLYRTLELSLMLVAQNADQISLEVGMFVENF